MKKFTFLAIMSLFPLLAKAEPLKVGDPAPQVSAPDENGQTVAFADVYAKGPVLVYFYPKAGTPGCTAQACSLRDAMGELEGKGLRILGVSGDSPEGQKKFKEKQNIPFTLISDSKGEVAKAFGVPTMMGLPARQSFLIKDGKVVWVTTKAKTGEHAAEVRAALDSLGI